MIPRGLYQTNNWRNDSQSDSSEHFSYSRASVGEGVPVDGINDGDGHDGTIEGDPRDKGWEPIETHFAVSVQEHDDITRRVLGA